MFEAFYDELAELKIVPVVVLEREEDAEPLADALIAGGMPSAEVTFRTPCAAACIRAMRAAHPEMCIGAGTALTPEQVDDAVDAGAEFIVSPGFSEDVVRHAIERGVPVLPGTVTPSEVAAARALGLTVTKFFPAAQYGGLSTIKALCAPFVGHRFMPTGGVSPANVAEYLASPEIIACGGTWMVKPQMIREHRFDEMLALTKEAAEIVRSTRA